MVAGMGGVLAGRAVWGLSDAELADAFTRNVVADRQLAAERLALIGELEARGVPSLQGFTSVASWLRQALRVSALTAARVAKLAKQLPGLPDAAKALGDGGISADQADQADRAGTDRLFSWLELMSKRAHWPALISTHWYGPSCSSRPGGLTRIIGTTVTDARISNMTAATITPSMGLPHMPHLGTSMGLRCREPLE